LIGSEVAVFFNRQTVHWLCGLTDVYADVCRKLEDDEPFAYSRFGDGEFRVMRKRKGVDGHAFFPDLGDRLTQIVRSKPDYMMGLGWGAIQYEPFEMSRGIDWVSALSLHTAAIEGRIGRFFDALDARRVTVVGPPHLRELAAQRSWGLVEILPEDCWLEYDRAAGSLNTVVGGSGRVFLFCASLMSNVLIDDLHTRNPEHTYVDVGSVLDPFAGVISRGYQDSIDLGAMAAAGYCAAGRGERQSRGQSE
jgi:hypothetical protein